VVALQLPITYELNGTTLDVTTAANVARAHEAGYAWHTWFGDGDADAPSSRRNLISWCVDGVMTARPRAFERTLKATPSPSTCAPARQAGFSKTSRKWSSSSRSKQTLFALTPEVNARRKSLLVR
jgi:hypothetical protein